MQGMSPQEAQAFHEKVAATAIANQAVLRCMLLGMPVNVDNVILCVSDFVDPTDYRFGGLIEQVQRAIDVTVNMKPYARNRPWQGSA